MKKQNLTAAQRQRRNANRKAQRTAPVSPAAQRALNDFNRWPQYKGQAASEEALLELERRGFVETVERSPDAKPWRYLTAQGRRFLNA